MTSIDKYAWAIYIDIEGFSHKFHDGAKNSFVKLTNDLFTLKNKLGKELSIIQFGGDGFLIHERRGYENNYLQPLAISVALLRLVLFRGGVGKVQISHGYMADIKGLYNSELIKAIDTDTLCDINGTMMINTIIGTGLIKAAKLKGQTGPLLIIDNELKDKLDEVKINYQVDDGQLQVNWLNYSHSYLDKVLECYDDIDKNVNYKELLKSYIATNTLKDDWKKNAESLLKD